MKRIRRWIMFAGALALMQGCGGGSATTSTSETGRLSLTVMWPPRSRLISSNSDSIMAVVTSGSQTLGTKLLTRSDGSLATPQVVTFDGIPAGTVTLAASGYPTFSGTGVVQTTGIQSVTIVSNQTAAVTVTMSSTIDHVTITPANPSITVGSFASLTMTAYNAAGSIVLTEFTADFVIADTSVLQESIGGNPGGFKGLTAGASLVTVTERETGKTASTTVTVTAAAPAARSINGESYDRRK